jgi:hypothetical protein
LGFPTDWLYSSSSTTRQPSSLFWRRCRGRKRRLLQGEFFARTSFTLF